jgi:uncharacterized OB-fold protein
VPGRAVPPAEICRACLGTDLAWERSAGLGTLYSWTVVHHPVTPAFEVPYAPAIVDLAEGYQMMTNLIGLAPEAITPGLPVEVEFHETGGLHLHYFRPRAATGSPGCSLPEPRLTCSDGSLREDAESGDSLY